MTETSPQAVFTGKIIKRKFGKGNKGERIVNAILTTEGYDLVIRHDQGTAFQDALFDSLEGQTVKLSGIIQSSVMVVDVCEVIDAKLNGSKEKEG